MKSAGYLLVCAVGLGLATATRGAESFTETDEQAWTNLVAAAEDFSRAGPSTVDGRELDGFLIEHSQRAGKLADRFRAYHLRYGSSPHALDAWENWMDLLVQSAYKLPERRIELEQTEQQYLANPKLSLRQRETILNNQVERARDPNEREQLVRRVMTQVESPTGFFCRHMLSIAEFADYPRATAIVAEILSLKDGVETPEWYSNHVVAPHTAAGRIAGEKALVQYYQTQAAELKRTLDRVGHPLQFKFTAFDGTPVDLERLRGKVVLLDFWATWCPPCVAGIPKVQAAWETFHKEGFEVIGLSYDSERERLRRFLERNRLPWPQFFDPEGKESPLIKSLGQPGPPAYWLIDRKGVLRDVNAHEALKEKVERLLRSTDSPQRSGPSDPEN